MKFSIKGSFSKYDQIRRFPADLGTFTEEILNGNLIFCAVIYEITKFYLVRVFR